MACHVALTEAGAEGIRDRWHGMARHLAFVVQRALNAKVGD